MSYKLCGFPIVPISVKRLCTVFYLLVLATPAAAVERVDPGRVFGAFLACKADIFSLLGSNRADFGAAVIRPYDWSSSDGVTGQTIEFAEHVDAGGLPLSGYVQFEAVGIAVPHFAWGFEVERRVSDVAKAIEGMLPGARFVAQDGGALELKLDAQSVPQGDASVAPEDSYRKIVVREANSPSRSLVMCDASKDRMTELTTDEETGRKRLPAAEDLFPSVRRPAAKTNHVLDAFVACKPSFFEVLKAERRIFPRVRIEPWESPDNAPHIPEAANTYNETVTFEHPVEIGGLRIVRFFQRKTVQSGEPTRFAWAFQVAQTPDGAARAIAAQYGVRFTYYWSLVEKDVDATPVSQHLTLGSYFDPDEQAMVTCAPDEAETRDFRLPEGAETFGWAELGPPPVSRGNRLVNALLQCRPDFFEALGEEKSAFGKVAFKESAGPYRKDGDAERAPMRVAFEKPVYASGFTLTGYIQRRVNVAGEIKLRWGFQTPVNASRIESTAEGRTGSVRVSGKEWLLDLETDETGYTPSPDLEFDEGFLGCTTLLASGVEPPKSGDLFLK